MKSNSGAGFQQGDFHFRMGSEHTSCPSMNLTFLHVSCNIEGHFIYPLISLVAQMVKNQPVMQETLV